MMLKAHQKFQLNHNQIYIIVHRSWLKMNRVLRASLRVPHPRLSFLFFWQKQKKHSPTVPHLKLPFMPSSEKKSLRPRIYARSYPRRIRPYQKRWKDIKIILFLSNPDVSFYEVEEHKHNFVSLSGSWCKLYLGLANELCQTIGDELFFFTWHIFLAVGKTQDLPSKIW